jgi:hypothetical protein
LLTHLLGSELIVPDSAQHERHCTKDQLSFVFGRHHRFVRFPGKASSPYILLNRSINRVSYSRAARLLSAEFRGQFT